MTDNNTWYGRIVFGLFSLLVVHNVALAYKETTHKAFSLYAVDNSVLNIDPSLLGDFGLPAYTAKVFAGSDGKTRVLRDIIAYGAEFEDDGGTIFQLINPSRTKRFFRHFFDPQSGKGLTFVKSFLPSPDWALERNPAGTPLDLKNPEQAYSYKDARKYFYDAFACQTPQCRQTNFSRTFQSVGQVIHHLQDMGQPQHTRLDIHPVEPGNFYGKYTETKNGVLAGVITANVFPLPTPGGHYFNAPRKYWISGDGKGMAEFTGTNFVTMGTMFRRDRNATSGFSSNKNFAKPTGANVVKHTLQANLKGIRKGEAYNGSMDFLEATITDPLVGTPKPVQLAAISILDAHLNGNELGFDGEPLDVLTVNSRVFDDRLSLLAPRIAAFSTDFINYFFRGRIDMVQDAASRNSWRILNNSAETMSGQFDLYAEDGNGNRNIVTGWNLTIPAGGSSAPQTFQIPTQPVSRYTLAFRGLLGVEADAVAGKILDINPVVPIPCGQPVNASGGTNGYDRVHSLGTTPGRVELDFETYSIPDAIIVTPDNNSSNRLAKSRGLVSGFNVYTFDYDPVALGTTNVRVRVTGNSNAGTAWVFTLGCPGQNLGNSDRAAKRVGVSFKFGRTAGGTSTVTCSGDILVDGKLIGVLGGVGGSANTTLTQGSMHQVVYSNAVCSGGSAFDSSYPATLTDSKGTVSIPAPPSRQPFLINIR